MIFRFPTINDKEILEDYVQEHYENNENCKEKNLKCVIVGCYKDNLNWYNL